MARSLCQSPGVQQNVRGRAGCTGGVSGKDSESKRTGAACPAVSPNIVHQIIRAYH
ncbi:hypothetical protein [Myxococcus qinghaiensis]|uniref:hypothetical protein n=1 Tax=Myxococcus qinghaiensis TaxID=2906758 RepID=UPI0020A74D03|nr:hypothetical protein [Myxococcus qinghaiensis]MCP3164287.1 hypothetical protein [Myxococcus qinghaiensis]